MLEVRWNSMLMRALTVDLAAIRHNADIVRAQLKGGVRMMCVVKADAYGHNAEAVARGLSGKADAFAVAVVEEGLQLREAGIGQMILVLGRTDPSEMEAAVAAGLSLSVFEPGELAALEQIAAKTDAAVQAHMKLDTGMSRLGVRTDAELDEMLRVWKQCPHVRMEGIFSHFSVSDCDEAFTDQQNARFIEMRDCIRAAGYDPICHCANSMALNKPKYQHDMVRAGVVLYGTGVDWADDLRYAQRLTTHPVRLEWIQPGDSVGYGRKFIAERPTRVMTLPFGYADGYPRALSGKADVLVRGKRAPLIGSVCMDMAMADVTDIPDVALEDEVVLIGDQGGERITPDELGEKAGTICYEIMLMWHDRVKRSFLNER